MPDHDRVLPVDFCLLGPIEFRRDGIAVPLGGPRQKSLLALLLQEPGRTVSTGLLMDELWAGRPPAGAAKTLRSYVSRLRDVLDGDVDVRWSAPGYTMQVAPEFVDTARFEALVCGGRAAAEAGNPRLAATRLRDALALWRGQPFGGIGTGELLRNAADRLAELRLRALEQRIDADLELGSGADLIDELEEAVRDHPYREVFWRQLMMALYRAERQADALAAYHRARVALDELGLAPARQLRTLESAILRQEVPAVIQSVVNHNLPAPLSSFVGREDDRSRVVRMFGTARLVTLTGVGGVGKTRLALEAAHASLDQFPDGVTFAGLASLTDPTKVASHIGTLRDLGEQGGITGIANVADYFRSRTALLILDNCEHLRDGCADLVVHLLQACPTLRVLATSREVLGVPGEVAFAVPPLTSSDAVELFLARAAEANPLIQPDDTTTETVTQICNDLDRLPLAVELAAARTRLLAPAEIAARLHDRLGFLVSTRRQTESRHRTLRATMDWSYSLLGQQQQQLLGQLSVFADGCTLSAVAAVCADGDDSGVLDLLGNLVDASLVSVEAIGEPTRYRLLETVRQYAAERCEQSDQTVDLGRRHAAYYADLAQAADKPLRSGSSQAFWVLRLAADRQNLRTALIWSRDNGEADQLIRMVAALWWLWWIRGELAEGRVWLEAAVARPTTVEPQLRGQVVLGLAGLAWAQGDFDAAEHHGQAAQRTFAAIGNHLSEGAAWNTLGLIAHGRLDLPSAKERFESALQAYQSIGDDVGAQRRNIAVTIDNLGSVAHELGDDDQAIELYQRARDINETLGDLEATAMNDLHLATVMGEHGRCEQARKLIAGALSFYRQLTFLQYTAECLESASIIANATGQPRDAAYLLGASAAMRERAGSPPVPFLARLRDREQGRARAAIGAAADQAYAEGSAVTSEDAMSWAQTFLATA